MNTVKVGLAVGAALGLAAFAGAEERPRARTETRTFEAPVDVLFEAVGGEAEGGMLEHAPMVSFAYAQAGFDTAVVKAQPYSAEATTEVVQTLADGNHIVQKTTATVARDAEGRTRREQSLGVVGSWLGGHARERTVFINDPVAGVNYVLDLEGKTALRHAPPQFVPGEPAEHREVIDGSRGVGSHPIVKVLRHKLPASKQESLGKRVIEGLETEGMRTTMTIPAGEIGNERPIEIVGEQWYSAELHLVVMSRHSDPRFGETTYRLAHFTRGEPSASLFEVPAEYTIQDGPAGAIQIHRKIEERHERH